MLNTPPAGPPLLPLYEQPIHVAFATRSILISFVNADRARNSGFRMKEQNHNHVAFATSDTFVNADRARNSGIWIKAQNPKVGLGRVTWYCLLRVSSTVRSLYNEPGTPRSKISFPLIMVTTIASFAQNRRVQTPAVGSDDVQEMTDLRPSNNLGAYLISTIIIVPMSPASDSHNSSLKVIVPSALT